MPRFATCRSTKPRAVLWASTDHSLVALRITGDCLVKIGSVPLAGSGLRFTIEQSLAAVAMGEKGVALFDIADPTQPKLKTVWTASHFAYDVSIDGARLYVAAGPEGVYLVDLSGDAPRTIGLGPLAGFRLRDRLRRWPYVHSGSSHERAASHRLHSLVTEEQVKPRFPLIAAVAAFVIVLACSKSSSASAAAVSTGSDSALLKRADHARIEGSASAPVWVIEVSDFQCPFCRQFHDETYGELKRAYVDSGKVRLAYVNFPLSMHRNAFAASEAAMCAAAQDKFWPMHDALFTTQKQWEALAAPQQMFDSLAAAQGVDLAVVSEVRVGTPDEAADRCRHRSRNEAGCRVHADVSHWRDDGDRRAAARELSPRDRLGPRIAAGEALSCRARALAKRLVGLTVACCDHEPHVIRPSGEDHRSSYLIRP